MSYTLALLKTVATFVGLTGLLLSQPPSYSITDLGPGTANAINKFGQVVGTTSTSSGHAFLWQKGVLTDLGTLPGFGQSSTANGINDYGLVVGSFTATSGATQHAYLWVPGAAIRDLGTLAGSSIVANATNN